MTARAGWLLLAAACAGDDSEATWQPRPRPAPEPEVLAVCVNEVMARSEVGAEWFELAGPPGLALDGWWLLRDRDDLRERLSLDGHALSDSGFAVFSPGDRLADGVVPGLDGDGEELGLEAPDASRSWVTWGPMASDQALGRVPDCCAGEGCWRDGFGGSPGATNGS